MVQSIMKVMRWLVKNSIISIVRPLRRNTYFWFSALHGTASLRVLAFRVHVPLGCQVQREVRLLKNICSNGETISVDGKEVKWRANHWIVLRAIETTFKMLAQKNSLPAEEKVALSGRLHGAISYQCKLQLSASWSNKQNGDHVMSARVHESIIFGCIVLRRLTEKIFVPTARQYEQTQTDETNAAIQNATTKRAFNYLQNK